MLREIRQDVHAHIKAMSDMLDLDVVVVDDTCTSIASTQSYFPCMDQQVVHPLINQVVHERQVVVQADRHTCAHCHSCQRQASCKLGGFVGVPLFIDGQVVGAVCMLVPQHRQSDVFGSGRNPTDFLFGLADLLESKVNGIKTIRQLAGVQRERENLMDSLRDAYVTTDTAGHITYCNRRFTELFHPGHQVLGRPFMQVLYHPLLEDLVLRPRDLRNHMIFHEKGDESFFGFLTCTQLFAGPMRTGATFRFRLLDDARNALISPRPYQSDINFSWASDSLRFPEDVILMAKRLAVTDKHVLITGEAGTCKNLLAQCIHNFSDRSEQPIVLIDCLRAYREHVPGSIFAMLGKLQSALQSTIVFNRVERLPLPLQLELLDFLRRPVVRHRGGSSLTVNIRFILTAQADLGQLAAGGRFSQELYTRVSENTLSLPPLREHTDRLRQVIEDAMGYFARVHGREPLSLSDELMERLCRYQWPGNLEEVDALCDAAAYTGSLAVFDELAGAEPPTAHETGLTITQLERQMIAQLIETGQSKDKIARTLGMSRATLYRKIKAFGL